VRYSVNTLIRLLIIQYEEGVEVSRLWLRGDGPRRKCIRREPNTCNQARFAPPSPDDPDPDREQLQEVTDRINMILEEVAQNPPDDNVELAILTIPLPDDEYGLQLAWIDTSGNGGE